jgi:hypothetical protein
MLSLDASRLLIEFLKVRAASAEAPQSRPSISEESCELYQFTRRLSHVKADCIRRDRHRCKISVLFDEEESNKRKLIAGALANDDDGDLLVDQKTSHLETARIIPYSFIPPQRPSVFSSPPEILADADCWLIEGCTKACYAYSELVGSRYC